jgi:hypothetical protein
VGAFALQASLRQLTVLLVFLLASCGPEVRTTEAPARGGSSQSTEKKKNNKPAKDNDADAKKSDLDDDDTKDDLDDDIVGSDRPQDDVIAPDTGSGVSTGSGSGGAGGRTGTFEDRFTASNGKSSTWKTTIPDDAASKTYGLNIYLHGDGGGDYTWVFDGNVRSSKKLGLIGVVVMAPNAERRWYNDGMANARFLDELIQNEILKKYNIDRTRIYFTGTSGGSQFLGGQFIPTYGSKYNSGALLLCGGPKNWLGSIQSTPEFVRKFKFYWYAGTGDFLYDQITAGMSYYKGLGMQVDSEMIPGGSHCEFPGNVPGAIERKLSLIVR